jgi:hypothetical protein
MRGFVLFLCILVSIASCAPKATLTPQATTNEAKSSLINFFALLSAKKYAEADSLYSGSYEQLQVFNPDVDANDHTILWQRACEISGLQCLQVRTATLKHQEGDTYIFQVEFNNLDRSLFVLGPCCGANETEMPRVSQFEYTVMKTADGKFLVMNLPPYVP